MSDREPLPRFLFKYLAIATVALAVLVALLIPAEYAAVKTAYGGGSRWSRSAAEAHCRDHEGWVNLMLLKWVPDSEFLPVPPPDLPAAERP